MHPSFKLYLHTKLSNPHYPPEVQAETTLVNFAVTEVGLVEQLLSLVVRKEMFDLACQRDELLLQQNQYKIEVKRLEDQILAKLAAAEGDVTQVRVTAALLSAVCCLLSAVCCLLASAVCCLLASAVCCVCLWLLGAVAWYSHVMDMAMFLLLLHPQDKELIGSLEDAKSLSRTVSEKMRVAAQTQSELQTTAELYRSVAARGALLFFTMSALDKVNSFYKFSLNAFVVVFIRGIELVDGPQKARARLQQAARGASSTRGKFQVRTWTCARSQWEYVALLST